MGLGANPESRGIVEYDGEGEGCEDLEKKDIMIYNKRSIVVVADKSAAALKLLPNNNQQFISKII
jgi:hypothetical protein